VARCGLNATFIDVLELLRVSQVAPLADAPFAVAATDGLSYECIGNVLIGYLGLLAEELIRDMKYPLVRIQSVRCCSACVGQFTCVATWPELHG
jgi:hypothetical protein